MVTASVNKQILEYLHVLISRNVVGDKPYVNRYKGFIGELEFSEWLKSNRSGTPLFTGGYFLPLAVKSSPLDYPVYFTVTKDSCFSDGYTSIYKSLSQIPCRALYFIRWNSLVPFEEWRKQDILDIGIELPVPQINLYLFDIDKLSFEGVSFKSFLGEFTCKKRPSRVRGERHKSLFIERMKNYDQNDLLDLYVQRLIFDGYLGLGIHRGLPSDIDFIIHSGITNEIQFLEVKEKDLSKNDPQGFGMDTRRITEISNISQKTGVKYFYIVRIINNQAERKFIEWLFADMVDFAENLGDIIPGGSGMRKEGTYNPTRICPYVVFKKLK